MFQPANPFSLFSRLAGELHKLSGSGSQG